MRNARVLTILVTIDAEIAELTPVGSAPVKPPTINDIRDALLHDAPFGDYVLGVALMAERVRPMTEEERKFAISTEEGKPQ